MHLLSRAVLDGAFALLSQKISHLYLAHIDSMTDLWHATLWACSRAPGDRSPPSARTPVLWNQAYLLSDMLHMLSGCCLWHRSTGWPVGRHTGVSTRALRRRRAPAFCHLSRYCAWMVETSSTTNYRKGLIGSLLMRMSHSRLTNSLFRMPCILSWTTCSAAVKQTCGYVLNSALP